MQKLHQKQLQKLKEVQKQKQKQYEKLLTQMINSEEQLKYALLFSQDVLENVLKFYEPIDQNNEQKINNSDDKSGEMDKDNTTKDKNALRKFMKTFSLSDFTPSAISKIVFNEHLIEIKKEFDKLPDSQAKLQNFILIMTKILFINPSRMIKKEKEQQIHRTLLKQENKKKGLLQTLSPLKKPVSPKKKLKAPPILLSNPLTQTKQSNQTSAQQQHSSLMFDNVPFHLMSLHLMFKQILNVPSSTISFHELEKFIMGELVSNKNQKSNTEFTIQFEENKKQDFLLHDNGIRGLYFCNGLKNFVCLDVKQTMIKIYTEDLKNKLNFQPNRVKHNRRSPEIIDMFYSDFNNSMGLVLSDKSIEIVNFEAFLTKLYEKQFLPFGMYEIVVRFQFPLKKIIFLQMFNKWLVVGQKNELILVDCSKYRSKDEEIFITNVKNDKSELNVVMILEVIALGVVCIVAQNQVWFFDQKLSKKKYHTYVHELNITSLKYYQDKNVFYLCGYKEKSLTILKPQRGRQTMEIHTLSFSRPIMDFQVFSLFGAIVLVDDKHTVRLVNEQTRQVYQTQDYSRIVKEQLKKETDDQKTKKISILKLNRQNLIIYQSYMISLNLAKVAVETEMDFEFLPYFYFDQVKQDISISFNNQVFVISPIEGEVRQQFTLDNSNLEPLSFFYLKNSHKWKPFVVGIDGKVFDLVLRQIQGVNEDAKKYKKKLQVKDIQHSFFDQQLGRCLILTPNMLYQAKNQTNNTFSTTNITNFSNFEIISYQYITSNKTLLVNCLSSLKEKQESRVLVNQGSKKSLTKLNVSSSKSFDDGSLNTTQKEALTLTQSFILALNINQPHLNYSLHKYRFQKIHQNDKQPIILHCHYLSDYDIQILLTDQNTVYLIDCQGRNNTLKKHYQMFNCQSGQKLNVHPQLNQKKKEIYVCIKLYHFISPKVRDLLKFNNIEVVCLKIIDQEQDKSKKSSKPNQKYYSLFVTSEQGFFIEIKLNKILANNFPKPTHSHIPQNHASSSVPEQCEVDFSKFTSDEFQQIVLDKSVSHKFQNTDEEFFLVKAHNVGKIEIIKKLYIEFLITLTVGKDGFLKLWNENKECFVSLKLPTLRKEIYDIKRIEDIRAKRIMTDARNLVRKITSKIQQKHGLRELMHKTRHHDMEKSYNLVDQKQPIRLEIENKFIQQIVYDEPNYYNATIDPSSLVAKHRLSHKYRYKKQQESWTSKQLNATSLKKQKSFESLLDRSRLAERNSIAIPSEILQLRKPLKRYEKKQRKSLGLPQIYNQEFINQNLLILPKLKEYKMESRKAQRIVPLTERTKHQKAQTISDSESEYDNFEACLFVKNQITRKKANELDRIDKQFIRKQYSMAVKKHLAKKKNAVQIATNRNPQDQKLDDSNADERLSLQAIMSDIKKIRYESKFGGDRHIPKVKFTSHSQLQ